MKPDCLMPALTGALIGFFLALALLFTFYFHSTSGPPAAEIPAGEPFVYSFRIPDTLQEAGSMRETTSPYWWLNSGGQMIIENDTGMTIQGETESRWRTAYARANAGDTDDGAHPQNLFRLISRSEWDNVRLESGFRIEADNLSASENRNESNGLLLMSRYEDSDTLYYAGLRVDGHAVIKKKYRGTYYTMAEKPVYQGSYDRDHAPNLLPHGTWIRLRSETVTANGVVTIRLFRERDNGSWEELLSATDDGVSIDGTPIIAGPAYVGIRTDFMDVTFEEFRAEPL